MSGHEGVGNKCEVQIVAAKGMYCETMSASGVMPDAKGSDDGELRGA